MTVTSEPRRGAMHRLHLEQVLIVVGALGVLAAIITAIWMKV